MRKLFILGLLLVSVTSLAQNKLSDRIYFGGGGGLNVSSNQTNISASPQIGYKVTDRFIAGVGITYQYVKIKAIDKSLNNFGWSIFNIYSVTDQIFAYGEFERLTFEFFTDAAFERTDKTGYNSLLLGAGFANSIGGRAAFNTMVLYNVLYDPAEPGPYRSPWVIRAGIGVGIF